MSSINEEKSSVLIVDDIPDNLALIAEMLKNNYRCLVAASGAKALQIANRHPQPDLILLDILMPGMTGYDVCRALKSSDDTSHIPVIFLTAMEGDDNEAEGFNAGGVDYITKPVNRAILMARVNAQLTIMKSKKMLQNKNDILEAIVNERSKQLTIMQDVIIFAMASLSETRNNDTTAHIRRIQAYTLTLAKELQQNSPYKNQITDKILDLLYKTSLLHDIGKVGVPDSILFKPGKFTPEEFAVMKNHAFLGGKTLTEVEKQLAVPEAFVSMAHDIALHHHERFDGTGYPLGLKGQEIPLSARIVSLADTYDALVSSRVYNPTYSPADTARIIQAESGKQFDPVVVEAFMATKDTFTKISHRYPDKNDEQSTQKLYGMMGMEH